MVAFLEKLLSRTLRTRTLRTQNERRTNANTPECDLTNERSRPIKPLSQQIRNASSASLSSRDKRRYTPLGPLRKRSLRKRTAISENIKQIRLYPLLGTYRGGRVLLSCLIGSSVGLKRAKNVRIGHDYNFIAVVNTIIKPKGSG